MNRTGAIEKLDSLQKLGTFLVTGAFKSILTATLEVAPRISSLTRRQIEEPCLVDRKQVMNESYIRKKLLDLFKLTQLMFKSHTIDKLGTFKSNPSIT